jgi:hypothetical protein
MLMMRPKISKDSSRGFQVNSEISFLISDRKIIRTSDQTIDLTTKIFSEKILRFWLLHPAAGWPRPVFSPVLPLSGLRDSGEDRSKQREESI